MLKSEVKEFEVSKVTCNYKINITNDCISLKYTKTCYAYLYKIKIEQSKQYVSFYRK